ncbi:MAG: hypothetical protein AB7S38_39710 [Vulcanimicrobiota bacterium]
MELILIWLTLGLGVLMTCGLDETIAAVSMDVDAEASEASKTLYGTVCLMLMVLTWPIVLLEMVRTGQK